MDGRGGRRLLALAVSARKPAASPWEAPLDVEPWWEAGSEDDDPLVRPLPGGCPWSGAQPSGTCHGVVSASGTAHIVTQ